MREELQQTKPETPSFLLRETKSLPPTAPLAHFLLLLTRRGHLVKYNWHLCSLRKEF